MGCDHSILAVNDPSSSGAAGDPYNNPDWFVSGRSRQRRKTTKEKKNSPMKNHQQSLKCPSDQTNNEKDNETVSSNPSWREKQICAEQADHAHEMDVLLGLAWRTRDKMIMYALDG